MSNPASEGSMRALFMKEMLKLSNAQCWKRFPTLTDLACETNEYLPELPDFSQKVLSTFKEKTAGPVGAISAFDTGFPVLNPFAPVGERPFVLLYRGDISLLNDLNRNVAVIGSIEPDYPTLIRERAIVEDLVNMGMNIVSGLAKGCDTFAHQTCISAGGKTIAILPTTLNKIYPAENRDLAEKIVAGGGLLISEYVTEPNGRYEAVKRFSDRDRLQAMFSKAVILIASHRRGEGDCGSQYAMESAKKYQIARYALYDREQDEINPLFSMNRDYLSRDSDVKVIDHDSIQKIAAMVDGKLNQTKQKEQIRLDMS